MSATINATQEVTWDTITFEEPYSFLSIDSSDQCIWKIAPPQKLTFNEAYAGVRAILTDSTNAYPINNYSWFDLKIGEFNMEGYGYNFFIEFRHRYDTDESHDGGFVTVSIDSGKTWTNIINSTLDFDINPTHFMGFDINEGLYTSTDTLFNGELGFSGQSDGWLTTSFGWGYLPVKAMLSDTMILRFNFISDDIETGKEGWMIDNIRLFSADLGGAVHDAELENLITVFPNPGSSPICVKLDKTYPSAIVEVIDLKGRTQQEASFSNTDYFSLEYTNELKGMFFLKITLDHERYVIKKIVL
jgi:hypothetical protein